ncbi:hypothetical protein AMK16_08730 [Streptomyces sp. CB00455]|uniref:hypothetical protein n=1 Tax=Streptomyces sp. CB00455 TaxID=1703927 RepID=UPI00093AB71E|nr:hypothetical protein [Streptomyces sp. CB00455]OKK20546.1 hypothetical protein AMK16_08730 [Streptomyces sp. CB00455]
MADDPFVVKETPGFSVMYTLGLDDDPESVEDVDAVVTAPDGSQRTASLMTHRRLGEVMRRRMDTGESAGGLYIRVPDLVIMREGGLEAATRALVDLFDTYGLDSDILPHCPPDDD